MHRLSYANVTASLALFVALSGVSFAALDRSPRRAAPPVGSVQVTGSGVSKSTTCPAPPSPCPTPTPEPPAVRLTVDVERRANLLLLATGTYSNSTDATLRGSMSFEGQRLGTTTTVAPKGSAVVAVQHLVRNVKPGKRVITLRSGASGGTFGSPLDHTASVVVLTLPPS